MTRISLRSYEEDSPDDPALLQRLEAALRKLLSPGQRSQLSDALQEAPQARGAPQTTKKNRIFEIVQFLSTHRSSFCIGHLILRSGVNVREYREDQPENPIALQRVERALRELLSPTELKMLKRAV